MFKPSQIIDCWPNRIFEPLLAELGNRGAVSLGEIAGDRDQINWM